jgi:hypothetical protein
VVGFAANRFISNSLICAGPGLTLNPAWTDNTFIALNSQPAAATKSGGTAASSSFVVNLNEPNVVQAPEILPGPAHINVVEESVLP